MLHKYTMSYALVLFMLNDLRQEIIDSIVDIDGIVDLDGIVDIDGIVDLHSLDFLFISKLIFL